MLLCLENLLFQTAATAVASLLENYPWAVDAHGDELSQELWWLMKVRPT